MACSGASGGQPGIGMGILASMGKATFAGSTLLSHITHGPSAECTSVAVASGRLHAVRAGHVAQHGENGGCAHTQLSVFA